MAEEEEDSGNAQRDGNTGALPDPENGWEGAVTLSQVTAEKALEEHLVDIVNCILNNVPSKQLPSTTLLFDLAARAKSGRGIQKEECESLAEVLMKEHLGLLAEEPAN